jgi:N-acetyl-gamma-glutamyl-phosphate reductase
MKDISHDIAPIENCALRYSLGIVGARGYVGKELLNLLANHPYLKVDWISSRKLQGQSSLTLSDDLKDFKIETLTPEQVGQRETDIVVLALPNGLAAPYVEALATNPNTQIIIDLSADYRFHPDWIYSLPELDTICLKLNKPPTQTKISNPGCYATAMQLALAPVNDWISGRAHCFGVSGYSGAGTKPCANNNPDNLKDNIIGYSLVEHQHEREVTTRFNKPVSFTPHVAAFFRGINMTVQVEFKGTHTAQCLFERFEEFYADEPLIICQQNVPTIAQVVNTPNCLIGGFSVSADGKRATFISCIDNLLKGAATQALQNLNLVLGHNTELALVPCTRQHQV